MASTIGVVQNAVSRLAADPFWAVFQRGLGGISWQAGDYIVVSAFSGDTLVYFKPPTAPGLTFTEYHAGTHTDTGIHTNQVFYVARANSAANNQVVTGIIARHHPTVGWGFQVSVVRGSRGVGAVAGARNGTTGAITIEAQAKDSLIYWAMGDFSNVNWTTRVHAPGFTAVETSLDFLFHQAITGYYHFTPNAGPNTVGLTNVGPGSNTSRAALELLSNDTPPTAPTNVVAVSTSANSASVSWTPATDDKGVVTYRLYRDGVVAGETSGESTTWVDVNVNPLTTYVYTVSAIDTNDTEGPRSAPVTLTTPAPPAIEGDPLDLSSEGTVGLAGAALTLTAAPVALSGDGAVVLSGPRPAFVGPLVVLAADGSLSLSVPRVALRPPALALSAEGALTLSAARVTTAAAALLLAADGSLSLSDARHGVTGSPLGLAADGSLSLSGAVSGAAGDLDLSAEGTALLGTPTVAVRAAGLVLTADGVLSLTGARVVTTGLALVLSADGSLSLSSGRQGVVAAPLILTGEGAVAAVADRVAVADAATVLAGEGVLNLSTGQQLIIGAPMGLAGEGALVLAPEAVAVTAASVLTGESSLGAVASRVTVAGAVASLGADGSVGLSAARPAVAGAPVGLLGAGDLALSAPRVVVAGGLTLDGGSTLGLVSTGWGLHGLSMALSGEGTPVLVVEGVTVAAASLSLTAEGSVGLVASRVVVPATGSMALSLAADGSMTLTAPRSAVRGLPMALSGDGVVSWVPVRVVGGGHLDISSTGHLDLGDTYSIPVSVWDENGTWRMADVVVWSGRNWLDVPAPKIHIY